MARSRDFYIYNDVIEAAAYFDDIYNVRDDALLVIEFSAVRAYRLNHEMVDILNGDFKDFPPVRSKLEAVAKALAEELTFLGTYLTKMDFIDDLPTSDEYFGKIDYLTKLANNICYANNEQIPQVITITSPSGEVASTHIDAILGDLLILDGFMQEVASIVFKTDLDSLLAAFNAQYGNLDRLDHDAAYMALSDLLKINYIKATK